jgi:hypothetical protein
MKKSMGSINNVSSNYLQSVFSNLQSSGLTPNTSVAPSSDSQQLSPFAQLMSTLQKLQQSDPAKYQQVTQQIATNLTSAARTAQADGNPIAANQLNQLATDFTDASTSGQLPNVQDLAKATGGHPHQHHHHSHAAADPDTSSSANETLNQLLSSLQTDGMQNSTLDPATIIFNTLSNS